MSMDGQGTHGVYKHCQKFQPAELAQERYTDDRRQTTDRQTTDRHITDGVTTSRRPSERMNVTTFAKNCKNCIKT